MKYIGIDLGTSFIKKVLLDLEDGKAISVQKYPSPGRVPHENQNRFEIPARSLVDLVKNLIEEDTKNNGDIEGVIISTQMHGFVYSVPGREDTYISWQDMRCMDRMPGEQISYLQWMEKQITKEDMKDNGVYLKPSLAVCNLYTLLEQEGIPRNGTLYTLGSYVIHGLTGNNICHISNAAPLGLADVAHHCWDRKMLERMNLCDIHLPCLAKEDYEVCGVYESNGCSLKIYPDYGDMQVSILGCDIREGDVIVNIGTGAQVLLYAQDFLSGEYEVRPYFEHSYLNTISNMPAGRNLNVLVNFLCEAAEKITGTKAEPQDVWNVIHGEPLVKEEELTVETAFYKNPYFLNGGSIRGITHSNLCLGSLFYAAFEDMAKTYWNYIQNLGAEPSKIKRIVCAGGVSWKTPELRKILEEVSEKPCELSAMEDEALLGMYRLAAACSGMTEKNFDISK